MGVLLLFWCIIC